MILMKNKKTDDALKEFLEVEELECKVYGENSIQVAKTLRLIGRLKA